MGAEYELKYAAAAETQAAIMGELSGVWKSYTMQTTYYDTPCKALSARRWTLRTRLENGISVCTVKTPAPGSLRGEWETECASIGDAIPMLCKLGAPEELEALCREGLVAVCGARFTRQALLLEQPAFTAEVALDKGILAGGGKELPLCECELELKSGSQAALDAFAAAFSAKYGLVPEAKSKFARALALCEE